MSDGSRGRMPSAARPVLARVLLAAALALAGSLLPLRAQAQYLEQYFPAGVPGYGQDLGVTVLSRLRPLYEPEGVRAGDFVIRSGLDEATGYNSNVQGFSHAPGSWELRTSPYASAYSDWSRDKIGAAVSLDNYTYFDTPSQNETDAAVSVGGGYTIGRSDLDLGYSYLSQHQSAVDIGAVASDRPVHYQVNDLRSDYTFDLGRLSFTPNVDLSEFQFDNTTVLGVSTGQQYRNRVVASGGVATRYELSEQHNLLVVVQGADSHYTQPQPGQPTNNSASVLVMAGIDYQASGVFRYRLLAGVEHRAFEASQYKARTEPVLQAAVIWTPTGLTTVTATASRTIEDVAAEGTQGYIYSRAGLVVDHEYLRNVLLQARAGFQAAQYLTGGTQTSYTLGGGVTWLLNRHVRLSADYDYTDQRGAGNTNGTIFPGPVGIGAAGVTTPAGTTLVGAAPNTLTSGSYTQHLLLLTLRLAL